MDKDVDKILKKYSRKIEQEVKGFDSVNSGSVPGNVSGISQDVGDSKEYAQFKQDMMPELSKYEKWVRGLGSFIKIKLALKDEKRISKQLESAHLDVSPGEVVGLAIMSFIGMFFIGILISVAVWLFGFGFPVLFLVLMLITSFFLFYYFY